MPEPKQQPAAHTRPPRLGVLLVNLGSPDEPTPRAIRRYLAEFLSDRRVIELPRLLWQIILRLFILPLRPRKIAENYQRVWTDRGSPLAVFTADLTNAVRDHLTATLPGPVSVDWAMRYGKPSLSARIDALRGQGAERLLLLPLYPQYSATTTGTVFDAATAHLSTQRWVPALRTVHHYHDDAGYLGALEASVRQHWDRHGRARHLVMSFHGLPRRYVEQGDPYFCHCQKTARLLAERLQLKTEAWTISFQSQFGKAQWVEPKTTATLEQLAGQGLDTVEVICPGFAADCIETLDEICVENKAAFVAAGGSTLRYIPALNAEPAHAAAIAALIARNVAGWPEADSDALVAERARVPSIASQVSL